MPPTTPSPARSAAPKRKRGEGQWKLGHREPLTPNERVKKDDDGLNVRARIETIYSKRGFDSIDPADLRGRMRWWGLYTQRRPGIDGGRTAVLEPEELDDRYFMLRVRLDGGALTTEQLRALGEVSQTYARDTADVTDRQNIQYHWIEIESMPAIWQRLESLGMVTTEACGDTPRVILGSPVAGIAADEEIDPQPAIDAILERYIGDKRFSNLPRKFKTAISWQQDVAHEVNDVSFIGVVHPEHGPGFDLWVGGGLSTNPKIAQRLGVWVPLDEVPDVWEGVISIFRDYGYRRLRHRARIKFLVADWGVEKFRQVLQDEYLHRALVDGPAPATPERPIDHVGVHKQRDGLNYVGVAPASGRVSGTTLVALADAAEAAGSRRVRLTPQQKVVVLDVPDGKVDALKAALNTVGLAALDDGVHRHRVLQAGDRRDQGAGDPAGRGAGEAPGRRAPGRPDLHPPQRLPERLRPHPGRRHRPQGHDRHRRRGQPGRGVPGAPGWRAGAGRRVRAQAARTQDHQCRAGRLRGPAGAAVRRAARAGRAVRPVGPASCRSGSQVVDRGND